MHMISQRRKYLAALHKTSMPDHEDSEQSAEQDHQQQQQDQQQHQQQQQDQQQQQEQQHQSSCESLRKQWRLMARSYIRDPTNNESNQPTKVQRLAEEGKFLEQILTSWETGVRLEEVIHTFHHSCQKITDDLHKMAVQSQTLVLQKTHLILGNHMANVLQALENAISLQQDNLLDKMYHKGILTAEDIMQLKLMDRENTRKRTGET